MKELYTALAKAQAKIGNATKDKTNPLYKQDYATLSSFIDATKIINEHGLSISQIFDMSNNSHILITRLQPESVQFIESICPLLLDKRQDMQALGSACTYARKYSLAAILNLSQVDDDGNKCIKSEYVQEQKNIVQQRIQSAQKLDKVAQVQSIINQVDPVNFKIGKQELDQVDAILSDPHSFNKWNKSQIKLFIESQFKKTIMQLTKKEFEDLLVVLNTNSFDNLMQQEFSAGDSAL